MTAGAHGTAGRTPAGRRFTLRSQPTALIGREDELRALNALLLRPGARLVTLTGAPGVGKTRLALAAAAEAGEAFEHGACLVPLEALREAAIVLPAIAEALGLRESSRPLAEIVEEYLAERHLLLVLDNFEQVRDAALLVADLLGAAPLLSILVTSRAPLRLRWEREFPVEPLTLPPLLVPSSGSQIPYAPSAGPGTGNSELVQAPDRLLTYAAVALFCRCAAAARPDFVLTTTNAATVATICGRLDGLPLAIELAAARITLFTPALMLERLAHRLSFLIHGPRDLPPRQQSLRAAVGWSYELLAPEEQALFRQLGIFAGGATPEAVEAIAGDPAAGVPRSSATLDALGSLVQHNLVRTVEQENPDPSGRIAMLETLREYAVEQLDASGETADVALRHAAYFLSLAQAAERRIRERDQAEWLDRVAREHDNLRAALSWLLSDGRGETALELAGALAAFWAARGHFSEGRRWLDRALAAGDGAPAAVRAKALDGAGRLAQQQGDLTAARSFHDEALALRRELGDTSAIAASLNNLGTLAWRRAEYDTARAFYEESLALRRKTDDSVGAAITLNNLGLLVKDRGDYALAREFYGESLALRREAGDTAGTASTLHGLGVVALRQSDYPAARVMLEEALELFRALKDPVNVSGALIDLGLVCKEVGDYAAVHALWEECLPIKQELGDTSGLAALLHNLGGLLQAEGKIVAARERYEQGLALHRALGHRARIAISLASLGDVARLQGDYPAARGLLDDALDVQREIGDKSSISADLEYLALVARDEGNHDEARALFEESLTLARELGESARIAGMIEGLAALFMAEGQPQQAARLFGVAAAMREATGTFPTAAGRVENENGVAALRAALGEEAFAEEWSAGRAWSLEQAIDQALRGDVPAEAPSAARGPSFPAGLSRREVEVLRLIAAGRTNPEIAEALVLSINTIERHTVNIYAKLGARGRAEAIAFALRHDLD